MYGVLYELYKSLVICIGDISSSLIDMYDWKIYEKK